MNHSFAGDESDDKPLDPAVERVRRKLVRFAIVNIGILFLALAAVVAALAWRTVSRPAAAPFAEAGITLAPGEEVQSFSVSEGEIAVLSRAAGGEQAILVFSRTDGRMTGRYPIGTGRAGVPAGGQ